MVDAIHLLLSNSSKNDDNEQDTRMLRARTSIVPRNSGIQTVVPLLYDAMLEAEQLDPRIRDMFVNWVKNRELGMYSLSSEGADMLRVVQTERSITRMETRNEGPPKSKMDTWLYKDKLKNNRSGEYDKL